MKISEKIKELVDDAGDILCNNDQYSEKFFEIKISYDPDFDVFEAGFELFEINNGVLNNIGKLFEFVKYPDLTDTLKKLEEKLIDFAKELDGADVKYIDGKKYKLVKE